MQLPIKERFFLELLAAHMRGKGTAYIARALAERIERPVLFTNALDRVLVFHDPLGTAASVGEYVDLPGQGGEPDLFAGDDGALRTGRWTVGDQVLPYVDVPLHTAGRLYGHCVVLAEPTQLRPGDQSLVWEASLAALLVLKGATQKQEEQERYQDELIRDMLYNNYDAKSGLLEKANAWNWDLAGSQVVAVVAAATDQLARARELAPGLFQGRAAICACVHDQLVMILSCNGLDRRKAKEALQRHLSDYADRLRAHRIAGVRVGVGSPVPGVTDLYRSYQEAKVALEMGNAFSRGEICHFDEMGVFQFIFTQPGGELQDFCERVLGPILAYDAEMGTDLRDTLEAYIENHCQIPDCARALFVHENTLRNRLKKIQDLTGQDLRRIDHITSLFIALQIMHLGR